MVDSRNHARIRYERVNADTGEEVPWDRIVRAYEHDDGRFILLSDEELEEIRPKLTKTIEITEFVSLEEIDPLLFDKPYYLEPEKRGRKAYALLREALRKSGRAGVSRVVIRTREYLAAMFVRDDALVLMLLRFPQELRATSKLDLPKAGEPEFQPAKRELDLALRLIDEMTEEWRPGDFHDEYRQELMDYIERRISKGEVVEDVKSGSKREEKDTKVIDLEAYLEKSVRARKSAKTKPKTKTAKKRTGNASKKAKSRPA